MGLKRAASISFVVGAVLQLHSQSQHGARFAWIPQPKRSCRHLVLDHLNLHGGCHDILLDGKHERVPWMEDIPERWRFGNLGCSRALLLHAGVLDHHRHVSYPLSVHRLVHHTSFANGGILFHSHCSKERPWSWNVLPLVLGNRGDVGFWLCWRGSVRQCLGWIYPWFVRLGIHLVRNLRR